MLPSGLFNLLPGASQQQECFPLLSIPTNVIAQHLVPHLEIQEQAALSAACKQLRATVCSTVQRLDLREAGDICAATHAARSLGRLFPNCTSLGLALHSLHDLMYAGPLLLMRLVPLLGKLGEVSFKDEVLENMYEPLTEAGGLEGDIHMLSMSTIHSAAGAAAMSEEGGGGGQGNNLMQGACATCEQEQCSHDISSLLLALFGCAKASGRGIHTLSLSTKLVTDAETAAISHLTSLNALHFASEAGMLPGALGNLAPLTHLRKLAMVDTQGNNSSDIDAICRLVTQLTELHMGYCPLLQPPVLRALHQAAEAAAQKNAGRGGAGGDGSSSGSNGGLLAAPRILGSMISSMTLAVAAAAVLPGFSSSSSAPPAGEEDYQQQRQQQQQGEEGEQQPELRVLSVNIDAEEGEEILYEMSRVSTVRSLCVDSTDEFSFDPGFQPFDGLTNLERLEIRMPMSLANTQSLERCQQLRELHLISLPDMQLRDGSLGQVSHLELLDAPQPKFGIKSFSPFTAVEVMVVRNGADDQTLAAVGQSMVSLRRLELYQLPLGYTRTGVQAIASLPQLRHLVLELSQSSGKRCGDQDNGGGGVLGSAVQGVEQWVLAQVPQAVMSGVKAVEGAWEALPGVLGQQQEATAARALSAFVPPAGTERSGMMGMSLTSLAAAPLNLATQVVMGLLPAVPGLGGGGGGGGGGAADSSGGSTGASANRWFPELRELKLLGEVAAADADPLALSHLQRLEKVTVNAHQPLGCLLGLSSRGTGGGVTLEGVKGLVERVARLMEVHVTGGVAISYRVPGRLPGIYA